MYFDRLCSYIHFSGTKSWTRDGINPSLTCTGKHTVTCQFSFTAEYSSDGEYVCKGYNVVRSITKVNEMKVGLETGLFYF